MRTLYIDCLCFDVLVHKLASSKTTVDLNKAKGMLLFNSVLVELEHRGGGGGGGGKKVEQTVELLRIFFVPNRPLWTSAGNVFYALVVNIVIFTKLNILNLLNVCYCLVFYQ